VYFCVVDNPLRVVDIAFLCTRSIRRLPRKRVRKQIGLAIIYQATLLDVTYIVAKEQPHPFYNNTRDRISSSHATIISHLARALHVTNMQFVRPLVVFGPSGTGKSTLLKRLFGTHPDKFGFSISHTTRSPRTGEANGREYHFVSRDEFLKLVDAGAFIENAQFSGNLYGTSVQAVKEVANLGRRCILDIDAQGVRTIKAEHPELCPVFLFVAPPSLDALKSRLIGRGTETEDAVRARLNAALEEIAYVQKDPGVVDVIVVNDEVDRAYATLEKVALGEEGVLGDKLPNFKL